MIFQRDKKKHLPFECPRVTGALFSTGLDRLGWLFCRVTFYSPILVLFWLVTTKAKKNYEQKCRDKDDAEQAVHRSANLVNPKQQEKVPGRADCLKDQRFCYIKGKPISNPNSKWTCTQQLAISSFRLLGSSEREKPLSHFGGSGRARERRELPGIRSRGGFFFSFSSKLNLCVLCSLRHPTWVCHKFNCIKSGYKIASNQRAG